MRSMQTASSEQVLPTSAIGTGAIGTGAGWCYRLACAQLVLAIADNR
jgi:hypothetical protein